MSSGEKVEKPVDRKKLFWVFLDGAHLEKAGNVPGLGVQVDVVESRSSGQTGHGRHVSDQGVDEVGTGREPDPVDREGEPGGHTLLAGVVGQRQGGLGHADGQVAESCEK